ncbi:hypothetical protein [Hyphococcus sp.]|jgi:hypothetical protein|uniref:hypothetical protein n=1 Tax=Hyphococcus sp. TaxID=2038636 RepID=UPI003D0E59A6
MAKIFHRLAAAIFAALAAASLYSLAVASPGESRADASRQSCEKALCLIALL